MALALNPAPTKESLGSRLPIGVHVLNWCARGRLVMSHDKRSIYSKIVYLMPKLT